MKDVSVLEIQAATQVIIEFAEIVKKLHSIPEGVYMLML